MSLLGVDIGATKVSMAVFSNNGELLNQQSFLLVGRSGSDAGEFISHHYDKWLHSTEFGTIEAAGICVPGIYRIKTGTVWAPNIPGWDDYPLLEEIQSVNRNIPVAIDSDRACYILGETWQGNTRDCKDAIFLSVGTGIGAGIMTDGRILRGANDIAGAIGWMALQPPYLDEFINCGCFEQYASGEGIAKTGKKILAKENYSTSELRNIPPGEITAHTIFDAYHKNDAAAKEILRICIEFWGMAAANLVSLFNPEKIIFGGGVFGPAISLIPEIKLEAAKWAQPISMQQVGFDASLLGSDAGVYGAAYLALDNIHS